MRWDGAAVRPDAPRPRAVAVGIGYDGVDVAAATARGIVVCVAADAPTVSTAEHTVALILAAAKRLVPNQLRLRAGTGDYFAANEAIELAGRTLGLVGYGRIARRVGRAAGGVGHGGRGLRPLRLGGRCRRRRAGPVRRAAPAAADVISVHAPLTDDTRHLFDAAAFAAMPPAASSSSTPPAAVSSTTTLSSPRSTAGQVGAAALDVTDPEPLPADHPLLHRDDVLVTPHVASATDAGKLRLYQHAIDNAIAVLEGRTPPHVINPEVLERGR